MKDRFDFYTTPLLPASPFADQREFMAACGQTTDRLNARQASLYAHPAPSVEPVAWMTVEEDGTRHGLRGWSDGTHREVPLYMAPPDHREVMRQALDALESFDGVGDVVTWEKQGAKCYTAIAVLRSALGEKK
jgi:hypothetical protein